MEAAPVRTTITDITMNSTKNANTGIYRLLNIWFIEESIMSELPPGDVYRFCFVIGKKLTDKEKRMHMHPLKTVIPDRKWLEKMYEDGYTLTVITPNLQRIWDPSKHTNAMKTVDLTLIATKDERIVPLNNELMPASAFCMRFEQMPWFSDAVVRNFEPESRVINVMKNDTVTVITTPMVNKTTWTPVFLNGDMYASVINSYDGNKYSKTMVSRSVVEFMHLSKKGFKEGVAKARRVDSMVPNTVPETNLFAILTMIDHGDEHSFPTRYDTPTVIFDIIA